MSPYGDTGKNYLDKSENEQDRIRRMSRSDQEKYAKEAVQKLNEEGMGQRFGKALEQEFNIFGAGAKGRQHTRRRRK